MGKYSDVKNRLIYKRNAAVGTLQCLYISRSQAASNNITIQIAKECMERKSMPSKLKQKYIDEYQAELRDIDLNIVEKEIKKLESQIKAVNAALKHLEECEMRDQLKEE